MQFLNDHTMLIALVYVDCVSTRLSFTFTHSDLRSAGLMAFRLGRSCMLAREGGLPEGKLFNGTQSSVPVDPPNLAEALPGFPPRHDGERVWVGSEMAVKENEWVVVLTDADKDHLVQARRHFQGKGFILFMGDGWEWLTHTI